MATIVQGGPDLRFQAVEQGVAQGVDNYFAARKQRETQKRFLDAFRLVNEATSYEDAVQRMGNVDQEILSNPAALEILSAQIQMRFPPQEGVQIDTEKGVETIPVRKGDVAGAVAEAQKRGGRLTADVQTEMDRAGKTLEAGYKAAEFELKERATRAKEKSADAAMIRAKRTGMPKPSEKEKQIARLTQVLGVPLEEAIKIADNYKVIEVVPETGEARLKDIVTGTVKNVPIETLSSSETIPGPEEGESLFELAEAGTGPFSAARAIWAPAGAYMGILEPERTVEARSKLSLATQKLTRALKASDRFPVTELERIAKQFSLDPKVWDHPEVMRRRMVGLQKTLELWIAQAERDASDQSLPQDVRSNAKSVLPEMRNFVAQMAIPEEHMRSTPKEALAVPPEYEAHFSQREWNALSNETRNRLMQALGR